MIMYSIFLIMPTCFTLFVRSLDLYFVITFDELFHYILLIYDNQMIKFRLTIKFIGFIFFFYINLGDFCYTCYYVYHCLELELKMFIMQLSGIEIIRVYSICLILLKYKKKTFFI